VTNCFGVAFSAQVFCNGKTGGTLVGTSGTKLVFRDVCVTIDQTQILRSVSGVARSGEVLAILGPSGRIYIPPTMINLACSFCRLSS